MDLRNYILFAPQENSSELKYSPELVAGLFRRTVYTGLRDRTLRHEMRKHLDNVAISDAALMHELNQIIIQESEKQNKLQSKHSVSQISSTALEINSVKEAVKNDIASEMKTLRLEMTKLKELVGCSQSDARTQPTNSRSRSGCDVCQSTGKRCDHCWTLDWVVVDNSAQTRSLTHRETSAGRRRGTVGGPANKLSKKLFLMSLSTVT